MGERQVIRGSRLDFDDGYIIFEWRRDGSARMTVSDFVSFVPPDILDLIAELIRRHRNGDA